MGCAQHKGGALTADACVRGNWRAHTIGSTMRLLALEALAACWVGRGYVPCSKGAKTEQSSCTGAELRTRVGCSCGLGGVSHANGFRIK